MDQAPPTDEPQAPQSPAQAFGRTPFVIGDARVDPADGTVSSSRGSVRLEPKVMEVLVAMANRSGEVLSREALISEVWPDRVVTNDVLARCIYQLRSELPGVLGVASSDEVIETLRKRGYRFKIPPRARSGAETTGGSIARKGSLPALAVAALILLAVGAWWWQSQPQELRLRSIAVLPFANMTGDDQFESLADGFTEQISHALANVPDLRVSARTSAFYFKNREAEIPTIAERLGVESLLEGSVRRGGAELRVTVQLVRDDGFHIWSKEYDRPHADILSLQSDIAAEILAELGLAQHQPVQDAKPAANYVAYDRYLRGRLALKTGGAGSLERAVDLFQQAIEADSDYALAYSGLADAYSLKLARGLVTEDAVAERLDDAVERALTLDDRLAEAQASQGLRLYVANQFAQAESHLRQAVTLNPNYVSAWNWLGLDLVMQDRFSEAIEAYQQAELLDPLNAGVNRNLGANLMLAGRPDEGFTYLERAQQISPDRAQVYRMLTGWAVQYGRLPKALSWANRGLQLFDDDVGLQIELGAAQTQLGRWDEAGSTLNKAYLRAPEDSYLVDRLLSLHLAAGDIVAIDNTLARLDEPHAGPEKTFGLRRIALRWKLTRHLMEGMPDKAVALGSADNVADDMRCNAFGEPGPRLYLALALRATGRNDQAGELLAECLEDVNRILAQGGTYPRSLYRIALTLALDGQLEPAAARLREAVEGGWRAYWVAWNDPLWAQLRHQAPFAAIFEEVRREVERTDRALSAE